VLLETGGHLDILNESIRGCGYGLIVVSGLRVSASFERLLRGRTLHTKEHSETCKDVCETYNASSNEHGTLGVEFTWRAYPVLSSSARCSLFATCKKLTARELKEHTCVISQLTTPSDAQWIRAGRWMILQNPASERSSRVHPLALSSTLSRS
jgi:hypothetical protein